MFTALKSFGKNLVSGRRKAAPRRPKARPEIEPLEDRLALTIPNLTNALFGLNVAGHGALLAVGHENTSTGTFPGTFTDPVWGVSANVTGTVGTGNGSNTASLSFNGGGSGSVTFSGTLTGTGTNGSLFGSDQLSGTVVEVLPPHNVPEVVPVTGNDQDHIHAEYLALGGANGVLGPPLTPALPTSFGALELFVKYFPGDGFITWSPWTGAHAVINDAIGGEYHATATERDSNDHNVQNDLGLPTSDEMSLPGVPGAVTQQFQGGVIDSSASTGAHVVYGGILAKYNSLGGPAAYGLPTDDEHWVFNGLLSPSVRVQHFQNNRAILWSQATGAHAVYGLILSEYEHIATETDYYGTNLHLILGGPTSDEMDVPGVPGARMNTFQGGTIYWSQATGAHVVYGAIGALYRGMGGPMSYLGLPVSDEENAPAGGRSDYRVSYFQNGKIWWTPGDGAHAVQAVSQWDVDTGLLSFGGGNPVNAHAWLTVYANGDYHFWGNFNNYGWILGYNDSLVLSLVSTSGIMYTFSHQGNVGAQHVDSWDVWGYSSLLAANWADLEGGQAPPPQKDLSWDLGALVQDLINRLAQLQGWWISTVYNVIQNS
jgi:hypothetical protein